MIYGHDRTIHQTGTVDVEVDKHGHVVSVWFRCMPLPFTATVVDDRRADEMNKMYSTYRDRQIVALELTENAVGPEAL